MLVATAALETAAEVLTDVGLWSRIAGGLLLLAVGVVVGRAARRRLEPRLAELRTPSFGSVFSRLVQFAVVTVFVLAASAVTFPSVDVATMFGGLGVLSVAAGFAFQDVLSNLLAGLLLIFRQPFVSGDQVSVGEVTGTVEGITIRETRIRTFQGRLVIVPNIDVYQQAIEVQTEQARVRTDLAVGVGYDTDLSVARELATSVVAGVDGVLDDPAPEVELVGFGGSSMDFHVRYWTDSQQASIRGVRDRVVQAVYDAFNEAGIEFPFQVVTLDAYEGFADAVAGAGTRARQDR